MSVDYALRAISLGSIGPNDISVIESDMFDASTGYISIRSFSMEIIHN